MSENDVTVTIGRVRHRWYFETNYLVYADCGEYGIRKDSEISDKPLTCLVCLGEE